MEREQRPSPEEALQPERLGVQASKGSAGRLPEPEIWSRPPRVASAPGTRKRAAARRMSASY
jgi:hypothetical protein